MTLQHKLQHVIIALTAHHEPLFLLQQDGLSRTETPGKVQRSEKYQLLADMNAIFHKSGQRIRIG